MRYAKIYSGLFEDHAVVALSRDAQVLYIYLLSTEHGNEIGLFRIGYGAILDDLEPLGFTSGLIRKLVRELCASGLIKYDEATRVMFIPTFLKHNKLRAGDNVKGAAKRFDDVPANPFDSEFLATASEYYPELSGLTTRKIAQLEHRVGYGQAKVELRSSYGSAEVDPSLAYGRAPEQEQEQEQEIEQEKESVRGGEDFGTSDEDAQPPFPQDPSSGPPGLSDPGSDEATVKRFAYKATLGNQAVADLYNTLCTNLPKCKALTQARIRLLTRFRQSYSDDEIQRGFRIANATGWMNGKSPGKGHENWRADLEYLARGDNLLKLLEKSDRTPQAQAMANKPQTMPGDWYLDPKRPQKCRCGGELLSDTRRCEDCRSLLFYENGRWEFEEFMPEVQLDAAKLIAGLATASKG